MNRRELEKKLGQVTSDLLQEKGYIAFVDVFIKLGYLTPENYEAWCRKRVPFLEKGIQVNLTKINFIMKTVCRNCRKGKLRESWTDYQSWGSGKKVRLRFSNSGEEAIERTYATHLLKPLLMEPTEDEADQ